MTAASAFEESAPMPAPGNGVNNEMIRRLKVSGMLSFGPQGIDLPMEPLNVLIGPNGSGKSNFIEALALLQAAPRDLSAPVKRMGGISEWLWKGEGTQRVANLEVAISYPHSTMPLHHELMIAQQGERLEVRYEVIENEGPRTGETEPYLYYLSLRGSSSINDFVDEPNNQRSMRTLDRNAVPLDASILSQRDDPDRYPQLGWLKAQYSRMRLYRNWDFGPDASLRQSPRADQPSTFLTERGENLPLVLSRLRGDSRQKFVKSLQQLYDGIDNFHVEVGGGRAELFVVERGRGERYIPASRLSDGMLRYMALAAILLDPEPPPLVVIEEPELGLHPDVVLGIGRMLVKASEQTQLVVTTHSHGLIDALDDRPSSVVVCDKHDGESIFERLDPTWLKEWLAKYSLGNLWSAGDLGGNPW